MIGHLAKDCKENRKFDLNHIADRLPEEAWAMMKQATDEKDMDDFREVILVHLSQRRFLLTFGFSRLSRSTPRPFQMPLTFTLWFVD
jgi:hypothetical protein